MCRKTLMLIVAGLTVTAGAAMLAQQAAEAPRPPRRRGEAISPEKEEELLANIKKRSPEMYERLVKLRQESPDRYRMMLLAASRRYRKFLGMPAGVREQAQIEHEARMKVYRALRAIRETKDAAKLSDLRDELRQAVAEHFDAEQKGREKRLAFLEEQIKRLREDLKNRLENRDKVISERVERWLQGSPPGEKTRWHKAGPPGRRRPDGQRGPSSMRPPKAKSRPHQPEPKPAE